MISVRDIRRLQNIRKRTAKDIRRATQERVKTMFKLQILSNECIAVGDILSKTALTIPHVPKLEKDVADNIFMLADSLVTAFVEFHSKNVVISGANVAILVKNILTLLRNICSTVEVYNFAKQDLNYQNVVERLITFAIRLQSEDDITTDIKKLLLQPTTNLIAGREDVSFLQNRLDLYAAIIEILDSTEPRSLKVEALSILDKLTETLQDSTIRNNISLDQLEKIVEKKKESHRILEDALTTAGNMIEIAERIRDRFYEPVE